MLRVPLLAVINSTLTNNAVLTNNVQTMFFEPLPQEGTFGLVFKGQTTVALVYNATAAQIQTAFTAAIAAAGLLIAQWAAGTLTVTAAVLDVGRRLPFLSK